MDHHLFQLKFNWKKLQELYKEVQQLEKPPDRMKLLEEEEQEMMEQLKKLTEKADKDFRAEKAKEEQALKEKNGGFARVYAENAISMMEEWLIWNHMETQVNAMFCRVQAGVIVGESWKEVIECFELVVSAEALKEVSAEMDRFEQLVQNLDVDPSVMEDSTTHRTHRKRLDRLIEDITEELEREENCNQLNQLPKVPSTVGESPKGIGQD